MPRYPGCVFFRRFSAPAICFEAGALFFLILAKTFPATVFFNKLGFPLPTFR
jgi:hypothetical protein